MFLVVDLNASGPYVTAPFDTATKAIAFIKEQVDKHGWNLKDYHLYNVNQDLTPVLKSLVK